MNKTCNMTSVGQVVATSAINIFIAFVLMMYDLIITRQLRIFYFVGPWWHNAPLSEICHDLTGVESKWWEASEDRMLECKQLTEREFTSWNATITTVLYFAILGFLIVSLILQCCVVRPIIKSINRVR